MSQGRKCASHILASSLTDSFLMAATHLCLNSGSGGKPNLPRLLQPGTTQRSGMAPLMVRRQFWWWPNTQTTGLFNPSVTNRTPLISYIHAPILKPFGVVRAISGWFSLVYHEPWDMGNYPSKICHEVWTDFGPFGFSPDIEFQILCLSCCLLKSQE